jgi:hypothetical protein
VRKPSRRQVLEAYCNVRSYGAVGDGVTDDSDAVTLAIADGRAVYFPKGTYAVDNLRVESTTSCPGFFGDGEATITNASGTTGVSVLITITKPDFYVRRLRFSMPVASDSVTVPACGRALYFNNNDDAANWEVSDCISTGGKHFVLFQGVFHNNYILRNQVTSAWYDGIGTQAPTKLIIDGNTIDSCCYGDGGGSGGASVGMSTAISVVQDVVITGNIFRNNGFQPGSNAQEGLDLLTASLRSCLVANNIFDGNAVGGIELKTRSGSLSPDTYSDIQITGNLFRIINGRPKQLAIALNLTAPLPPAGKAAKCLIEGNLIVADSIAPTSDACYGISGCTYYNTVITGNYILNMARGIAVAPGGSAPSGRDCYIQGNIIDASYSAIHVNGPGTLANLQITHNSLRAQLRAVQLDSAAVNDAVITHNHIESTADHALELRNTHNSIVSFNEMKAAMGCILAQGTANTGVQISRNRLTTAGANAGDALTLFTGTGYAIIDNIVSVPSGRRTVSGEGGPWIAAENMRGAATSDPSAWLAGAVGDVVLNSSPASGAETGWVCTTAGDAGAATYSARGVATTGITGTGKAVLDTSPTLAQPTANALSRGAPVTKTGDFTVGATENWLINDKPGSSCTVTLPSAATYLGREIMIQNYQAQALVSASTNVVPLAGGAVGAEILAAAAGKWAVLVSNGVNWVMMLAN